MSDGLQRQTLQGLINPVGTADQGMSATGLFLFGGIFVAVGLGIMGLGLGFIPADPSSFHAPRWIITAVGSVFAAAGIAVALQGARFQRLKLHYRKARQRHLVEPAYADHPWDPAGYKPARWKPLIGGATGLFFMSLFLAPFHFWAWWSGEGNLFVQIIVSLFTGFLLFGLGVWIRKLIQTLKFGSTRLTWDQFPCRRGGFLALSLHLPGGLRGVQSAECILRCVEEYYVESGSGDDRSKKLVHEQIWCETRTFLGADLGSRPERLQLSYSPPLEAPPSRLFMEEAATAANRHVFWRLDVKLAVPGVDFEERYLVPVY